MWRLTHRFACHCPPNSKQWVVRVMVRRPRLRQTRQWSQFVIGSVKITQIWLWCIYLVHLYICSIGKLCKRLDQASLTRNNTVKSTRPWITKRLETINRDEFIIRHEIGKRYVLSGIFLLRFLAFYPWQRSNYAPSVSKHRIRSLTNASK